MEDPCKEGPCGGTGAPSGSTTLQGRQLFRDLQEKIKNIRKIRKMTKIRKRQFFIIFHYQSSSYNIFTSNFGFYAKNLVYRLLLGSTWELEQAV